LQDEYKLDIASCPVEHYCRPRLHPEHRKAKKIVPARNRIGVPGKNSSDSGLGSEGILPQMILTSASVR